MRRLSDLFNSPDFSAVAISLGLAILASLVPPHVYADQALQLTGVQAWQQGKSPFPNWVVTADPADLAHDRFAWELWHPAGFPLLIAGLSRLGLTFAMSLHLLAGSCFVLGCWGWVRWWRAAAGASWIGRSAPFLVPCLRYGNDNLLHFHAEAFLFAAAPWGLLLLVQRSRTRVQNGCLFALAALVPLFKYSALLMLGAGFIAAFALRRVAGQNWWRYGVGAMLPITCLMAGNVHLGSAANLVSASWHPHWSWLVLLQALAAPALILGDAGDLCARLDQHEAFGLLTIAGISGTLILAWLLVAGPKSAISPDEKMVGLIFLLGLAGDLLIVSLCDGVTFERRYLGVFGLALLPFVLNRISGQLVETQERNRSLAALFLLVYLALPAAASAARLVLHGSLARSVVAGPSGLWNPILGTPNQAPIFAALHRIRVTTAPPADAVWIWPEPLWALNEPGRCLYPPPGATKLRGRSSRPLTLFWVARDLTQAELNSAFPQVADWRAITLPSTNYLLWIGHLKVTSAR